jgi:hypothetical protein
MNARSVSAVAAMMFGMKLARLRGMMVRMLVVAVCHMGVMASLLDIVVAMLLGGQTVVLRGLLVMMSGLLVVLDHFVFRHGFASSLELGLNPKQCAKG